MVYRSIGQLPCTPSFFKNLRGFWRKIYQIWRIGRYEEVYQAEGAVYGEWVHLWCSRLRHRRDGGLGRTSQGAKPKEKGKKKAKSPTQKSLGLIDEPQARRAKSWIQLSNLMSTRLFPQMNQTWRRRPRKRLWWRCLLRKVWRKYQPRGNLLNHIRRLRCQKNQITLSHLDNLEMRSRHDCCFRASKSTTTWNNPYQNPYIFSSFLFFSFYPYLNPTRSLSQYAKSHLIDGQMESMLRTLGKRWLLMNLRN